MKVCFVGSGSIGSRHMLNLTAVCHERGEEAVIHALRSGARGPLREDIAGIVSRELLSIDELDSSYDAVFICNPTFMHYETIGRLKYISRCFFVEKPVFERPDYRLEDLELPGENRYYVACPLRYSRVIMRAGEMLADEKVISAQAISSSYLPDWRAGTDYRQTYSAKKEQGGGVRIDLIHEWDYLVELFGYPDSVASFSGRYSDLEISSEDIAVYIARYPGMLLELHLDYFGRVPERRLKVRTPAREYLFDILQGTVSLNGTVAERYAEDRNEMYLREMRYFVGMMDGSHDSRNTLAHACEIMKLACR